MVIELLGANLEELREFCGGKFSIPTILSLADQLISRIEFFHAKNFIHRDIKPDNFVMGHGVVSSVAYIIDFGLAKRYRDATTKMHIPYKNNKKLTGTARYASLNTHMGIEQSRRDDLECLAYSLVYLLKGILPWQGIRAEDKGEKYKKILERKKSISIDMLCKGLPSEFGNMFYYCRSLKFEDKPDYALLRKRFSDLFYTSGYNKTFDFDWNLKKLNLNDLLDREYSTDRSGENDTANQEETKKLEIQPKIVAEDIIPKNEVKKEISKEPEEEKKIVKKERKKQKTTLFMRMSSAPNRLKANFLKSKKTQYLFVTKKIKEMREKFIAQNARKDEDGDDEIPDENTENNKGINKVREFNLIENDKHWENFRHFRVRKDLEIFSQMMRNPEIIIHQRKVSVDLCTELRRQSTLPPRSVRNDKESEEN